MTADVGLAELDPAGLLRAAFDLQDQRDAARDQAAQLEAELAELTSLLNAAGVPTNYHCGDPLCSLPRCVLRRFLERPVVTA